METKDGWQLRKIRRKRIEEHGKGRWWQTRNESLGHKSLWIKRWSPCLCWLSSQTSVASYSAILIQNLSALSFFFKSLSVLLSSLFDLYLSIWACLFYCCPCRWPQKKQRQNGDRAAPDLRWHWGGQRSQMSLKHPVRNLCRTEADIQYLPRSDRLVDQQHFCKSVQL